MYFGMVVGSGAWGRQRGPQPSLRVVRYSSGDRVLKKVAEVLCDHEFFHPLPDPHALRTGQADLRLGHRRGRELAAPLCRKAEGHTGLRAGRAVAVQERRVLAPDAGHVGRLAFFGLVRKPRAHIDALQLEKIGEFLAADDAGALGRALDRLNDLGVAAQDSPRGLPEHGDVGAHHRHVERVADGGDRVGVDCVVPLRCPGERGLVCGDVTAGGEDQAGRALLARQVDQVGEVGHCRAHRVNALVVGLDVLVRHQVVEAVVRHLVDRLGGREIDLVGAAFAAHERVGHGVALRQVVAQPLEFLRRRRAGEHVVGDQGDVGIAVGQRDGREFWVDRKRADGHGGLLNEVEGLLRCWSGGSALHQAGGDQHVGDVSGHGRDIGETDDAHVGPGGRRGGDRLSAGVAGDCCASGDRTAELHGRDAAAHDVAALAEGGADGFAHAHQRVSGCGGLDDATIGRAGLDDAVWSDRRFGDLVGVEQDIHRFLRGVKGL